MAAHGNKLSHHNVAEDLEVGLSLIIYSGCSISMILLNKLVIDTYHLNYPMGLLVLQNGCALLLVAVLKKLGLVHYPDFDRKVAMKWLPLTVLFVGMLWTSMKSLKIMSVALGSYMGSVGDRWVTSWGLFWTFTNIFFTVSYVLYMKRLLGDVSKEIGRYGPVFYNNLLSLPFLAPSSIATFPDLLGDIYESPYSAKMCLLLMILVGSVMTFASFWCMKMTSPTTYSVTGALNKIPLAVMGIFIFGHNPTGLGWAGIGIALSGGVVYTWLNRPPKPPKETAVDQERRVV
ncbi:lipophosphoglycan biosynthetic protein, putative [Bodo saltans]|uniref:Lipophosphoglycan biosynthetic protein, putative n=1 Tax=Bodo saltans TaxID=75058 RepID=A0A0S4JRM6_BODSA|nr:lipophosphoglycan biosynthetic protein, putative [Bodo saltans]|eukprot:CUG91729.1 lipophosphoglycan biosynthetic protein, putative [Bodo saltans]